MHKHSASTVARALHFAQGLQRGVSMSLEPGSVCVIGASAESSTVVLLDDGVASRHCALMLDGTGRVTCTAFESAVRVGDRELKPGESMALPDLMPLHCGEAMLLVGPEDADWSRPLSAAPADGAGAWTRWIGALRNARATHPATTLAVASATAVLLVGSVWGAVRYVTAPLRLSVDNVAEAQQWLKTVAPAGSELQLISDETRQRLVVSGYVPTNYQRELLVATVAEQAEAPRSEVYSVEQLLASVVRMAQLEGLACVAAYGGAGRVSCTNDIDKPQAADRLRAASAQVAGLRELSLQVSAPPTVAPNSAMVPAAGTSPVSQGAKGVAVGRKFSIFMSKRGKHLIGPAGERYSEGDVFEGLTIRSIALDHVVFERDQQQYVFYVAQMR
jgi:hypothetical protein